MSLSVWYVSKYVSLPGLGSAGLRGYFLMRELARAGHKVTILTSDSNHLIRPPILTSHYLIQDQDDLNICWVRTIKYKSSDSFRRVLSWAHFEWRLLFIYWQKLRRPDIVIVSSLSFLTILNGFLLRVLYRCPLIFEVRDIWPLTLIEECGFKRSNLFVAFLGLLEYLAYRYSNAIVGTMPRLDKHVQDVLGFHRHTYCIPMGVDQSSLPSSIGLSNNYLKAFFPSGKFIVAHVGSIGITNALDAFFECANLMKDLPGIHFLAIGDGGLRDIYRSKYGHLNNLSFPPSIPKEHVQVALSHCDLLYFSSCNSVIWQYGQSLNKVVDYMLSGKPIVASYSGHPSMINEASCGTFVPANDVVSLMNEINRFYCMSDAERKIIGARGRAWLLKNRCYKKLAADYLEILYSVLATSGS